MAEANDGSIDGWKSLLVTLGAGAENALDRVRQRFARRFRADRRLHVVPYRGFGNAERCTLSGRVLVYRDPPAGDPESLWHTLQTSYRRFETDEVAGERVQGRLARPRAGAAQGAPRQIEAVSDAEGYFMLDFPTPPDVDGTRLELALSLPARGGEAVQDGRAEIVLPAPDARFGVVSDVDDTVLVTEATSLLRMMRLTLLESSASRVAFPGVAELYRALHAGRNPFFYVSSSPWNLYEFLDDFMRLKGIVAGPLLLRDFGLERGKLVAGEHREHKLDQIRRVLDRYPALPFLLVGDSGQHDPEIYREVVRAYPGRILAIYIRDVGDDARDRAVQAIVADLADAGVEMLLVPDTLAAARHAATRGWIDEAALAEVTAAVEADRATPTTPDEAMS